MILKMISRPVSSGGIQVPKEPWPHHVPLVDPDVERSLTSFVSSVQICTAAVQELDHLRLVSERRVVHRSITVFVLKNNKILTSKLFAVCI